MIVVEIVEKIFRPIGVYEIEFFIVGDLDHAELHLSVQRGEATVNIASAERVRADIGRAEFFVGLLEQPIFTDSNPHPVRMNRIGRVSGISHLDDALQIVYATDGEVVDLINVNVEQIQAGKARAPREKIGEIVLIRATAGTDNRIG